MTATKAFGSHLVPRTATRPRDGTMRNLSRLVWMGLANVVRRTRLDQGQQCLSIGAATGSLHDTQRTIALEHAAHVDVSELVIVVPFLAEDHTRLTIHPAVLVLGL